MNSPSSVPTVLPALGRWLRSALGVLALVPALWGLLALSPAAPNALAATRTWFVAPSGTDAACAANSSAAPFATIQTAIHCAAKGDVVVLAPSGSTPYPGIGAVDKNLTIEAASGANARTVAVDLAKPVDANGFSAGLVTVPAGVTARIQGVSLECASGPTGCLSQTCETTSCVGSLVTNHGVLTLMAVLITGAQHGAINNVSGAGTQANLTVTSSTIAHNTNDSAANDSQAAGISSTRAPGSPDAKVTVQNSTIADNAGTLGTPAGAIYTNEILAGAIALTNDTIADNSGTAAGGISTPVGFTPVIATNTIVAANTASDHASSGADCLGPIADGPGGHNLIGDNTNCSGVSNGVNGDLVEVSNPGLNPLANKSGSTDTISLQPQSPAIGSGDVTTCQSKLIGGRDERGVSRNATTRGCDIGAYDTAGSGGVAVHTWYVGPNGKASSCSANTSKNKFATVQSAVACASDGDVIVLAASGSTPYPGIGTVGKSVTIEAASGANASSVVVELSNPSDAKGFSAGLVNIPSSASVKLQNLGLQCTESGGHLCMSQTCETTHCEGSLVTNNGALSLTGVSVTGAKHGAGINDVSTGQVPARLTVTASTIAHNANDDTANDAGAAGISATATGGAADPHVTISNSTIDDNSGQSDAGHLDRRPPSNRRPGAHQRHDHGQRQRQRLQRGGRGRKRRIACAGQQHCDRGQHDLRSHDRRRRLLRHAYRRDGWSQPDRGWVQLHADRRRHQRRPDRHLGHHTRPEAGGTDLQRRWHPDQRAPSGQSAARCRRRRHLHGRPAVRSRPAWSGTECRNAWRLRHRRLRHRRERAGVVSRDVPIVGWRSCATPPARLARVRPRSGGGQCLGLDRVELGLRDRALVEQLLRPVDLGGGTA
ncbi:MAG TPA: choice-of-anchor Q domain-containing protein [Solirubrobacteraceae bacterium]|nr:choice-of-anchor Q domain-containing protein [Solirubrobacteraceae bacterium]